MVILMMVVDKKPGDQPPQLEVDKWQNFLDALYMLESSTSCDLMQCHKLGLCISWNFCSYGINFHFLLLTKDYFDIISIL